MQAVAVLVSDDIWRIGDHALRSVTASVSRAACPDT
jgi:hypothetical protein